MSDLKSPRAIQYGTIAVAVVAIGLMLIHRPLIAPKKSAVDLGQSLFFERMFFYNTSVVDKQIVCIGMMSQS